MSEIPRPRPKLMAIGDSLAQGCRSLTVKRDYCSQSWPARIAATQGWEFVSPDFPREILFDLEAEVRRVDTLSLEVKNLAFKHVGQRIIENLREWLIDAPASREVCFDNLALAGAKIHDLYTRTATTSTAEIRENTPNGADSDLSVDRVSTLHLAINGRFTLNPSRDQAFAGFTPLDWVRERRPDMLAVQIGHNHGLYTIGSTAKDTPFDERDDAHGSYFAQWERLGQELAALPAEVATVLVVLLPKVGAVANLRPLGAQRRQGYADSYEAVLSGSPAVLAGQRLAEIDEAVRAMNGRIEAMLKATVGTTRRLVLLDAFALFDTRDFKNSLQGKRRLPVDPGILIDNRYLNGSIQLPPPFGPGGFRVAGGGFQSIDGMHPTGCGYADIASEAMNALMLPHQRSTLIKRAFAEDSLLSRYPAELDVVTRLLSVVRDLQRLNHLVIDRTTFLSDQLNIRDALRFMRGAFTGGV